MTTTTTTAPAEHPHEAQETIQPVAAVLAALFPGAGHAYLGEIRRGILICAGVLGLFFGGMLIGGIGVVDRRDNFIWFLGQALVGPVAFGVDWLHQEQFKIRDRGPGGVEIVRPPRPNEAREPGTGRAMAGSPPYQRSLGRVHELGTLFATIAGMMNLICIIDAAYRAPAPRRRQTGGGTAPGPAGASRGGR